MGITKSVKNAIDLASKIRREADDHGDEGVMYAAGYILKHASQGAQQKVTLDEKDAKAIVLQFVQHLLMHHYLQRNHLRVG